MSLILGLHLSHDGSAALVKNGRLIKAISIERISRKKKDSKFTLDVFNYLFENTGHTLNDVDRVALSDFSEESSEHIFICNEKGEKQSLFLNQRLSGNDTLNYFIQIHGLIKSLTVIPHHLGHCASSYYTSNFSKSLCFSMDSSGYDSRANSMSAIGIGNKLTAIRCPNMMVGNAYARFTESLGIGSSLFKAGSTMGLSSYGKVSFKALTNAEFFGRRSSLDKEGHYDDFCDKIWAELSGQTRNFDKSLSDSRRAMNIAADIQFIFEQSVVKNIIIEKRDLEGEQNTIFDNLCLSGGSMLNCNTNSLIKKNCGFRNIHLFPGCGDDGLSVGCALYVAHHILNEPRTNYSNADISYLGNATEESFPGSSPLDLDLISDIIAQDGIVAWHRGRCEFGPRALGNRSILANPTSRKIRDILNHKIKKREWYRPFAPSVLESYCNDYFDFDGVSPFMLFTAKVKNPNLHGITHVDGTARMQTVNELDNPVYFDLINRVYSKTGIPMVLNTSLNGDGEPIAETLKDSKNIFDTKDIDVLVYNDRMLIK